MRPLPAESLYPNPSCKNFGRHRFLGLQLGANQWTPNLEILKEHSNAVLDLISLHIWQLMISLVVIYNRCESVFTSSAGNASSPQLTVPVRLFRSNAFLSIILHSFLLPFAMSVCDGRSLWTDALCCYTTLRVTTAQTSTAKLVATARARC